jgi:3-hydroxybutyryl-CoA dehydratase
MPDQITLPVAGETLGPLSVEVTAARVHAYAAASGDHNPIHLDPAFAAGTPFGATIAHGMLLLAYLSRLLTARFGHAWVEHGSLDARFKAPALVGARVIVTGAVQTVTETAGDAHATIGLRCEDGAGGLLVQATARLSIPRSV